MVRAALGGSPCAAKRSRADGGSTFDVEVHAVPMQYQNEPHVLAIVRDLTERKRERPGARSSKRNCARRRRWKRSAT